MHPVSFAFKRGHIRAVVAHRELLAPLEITPARFDVLFVLRARGGSCHQSEIWQELGLHPTTISRMVKSMVGRGLVTKTYVYYGDTRERIVTLTRKGFATVVEAIKAFIRADDLRSFYDRMHAKGVEGVKAAVAAMRNISEWLQDRAVHPYSAEKIDVESDVRLDAQVKEAVEHDEDLLVAKREGQRGLASLAPEDNPTHPTYFYCKQNLALKAADPAAWEAKLSRDWKRYFYFYGKAYPPGRRYCDRPERLDY